MTSAATHKSTKEFFKTNEFFGLDEQSVRFFRQGTLPAMDFEGRVIMESKHQVNELKISFLFFVKIKRFLLLLMEMVVYTKLFETKEFWRKWKKKEFNGFPNIV